MRCESVIEAGFKEFYRQNSNANPTSIANYWRSIKRIVGPIGSADLEDIPQLQYRMNSMLSKSSKDPDCIALKRDLRYIDTLLPASSEMAPTVSSSAMGASMMVSPAMASSAMASPKQASAGEHINSSAGATAATPLPFHARSLIEPATVAQRQNDHHHYQQQYEPARPLAHALFVESSSGGVEL